MNTRCRYFFKILIFISLDINLEIGITGSCGSSIFNFKRNTIIFHNDYTNLHSLSTMHNAFLSSTSSTMLTIPFLYMKPTSVSFAPFNSHSTFLTLIHTLHLSNYLSHLDYRIFLRMNLELHLSSCFGSQPTSLTFCFFSTKVCTSTYSY